MGTPFKIDDMAWDLIRLSGLKPDVDIKIEYLGLRPGENLITEGENIIQTRHIYLCMREAIQKMPV